MPSESDRLLIQQIRQGNPRAWENLIARYEGRLLAFVDRRLHDRAASEDVVQETFVGFLNSLPNFDEHRELQTYLFTIASHKLTDHLRRRGRHPLKPATDSNSDVLGQQLDDHPAASSMARSQERRELESGAIVRRGLSKVAVYRDGQGALHEWSAVCPHLGCIVNWNGVEKTWDCPCHGSRFDCLGRVINGPANRDLAPAASEKTAVR